MYTKTYFIFMIKIFIKLFIIYKDDKFLISDLQTCYQQITKFLLYIIIQTHSNLTTVLSKLSQFNVKINDYYFKAQIRALQYVRDMLDYNIIYISNNSNKADTKLAIYFNADYVSNSNTQKFMSDYIIIFYDESIS